MALLAGCKKADKPATADACTKYAEQLCEKTGKDSPACASIKSTTELMPPAACAAGAKDINYTSKKLSEQRKVCDELVTKLCTALGKESKSCKMVEEQTKQFPPERCKSFMEHYDEVLASLQREEAKNKPLSPELMAKLTAGDPPSHGKADAAVTIVEFSDFQCPYCSRAAEVVKKIRETYGDKVRFVFREFPLSFHNNAAAAAALSLEAQAQGKFWEMHDLLFANQKELSREKLEEYAKKVGLDAAKVKKALDENVYKARIDEDTKLGTEVGVDGTPSMFLNGERVANPTDFEGLKKLIDAKLGGAAPAAPADSK